MARFTVERREWFLTLMEAGRSMEEACAAVGVSRPTVSKWRAEGRQAEGGEKAVFAERLDAIRSGEGESRLQPDDVVRMLEVAARNGSVQAMRLLLTRPWEAKRDDEDSDAAPASAEESALDELAAIRRRRSA